MSLTCLLSYFMSSCLVVLSSLYVLDTNPLLDVWLAKVLSHSVGHLFAQLTASFTVQSFSVS